MKHSYILAPINKYLRAFEKIIALLEGRGYGAFSVQHEVEQALSFLNSSIGLAIDIGGNVGNYTAALLDRKPKTEIHIFEPSMANLEILNSRFHGRDNVKVLPFAVSDKSGHALLHSDRAGSGLASLSKRRLDHFGINFDLTEDVHLLRFEDYWKDSLNKRSIDLIKIDIEGHELAALNGLGEAINHVNLIQFEFGGCNIDTRTFFQDFWYFFTENKFKIVRLSPFGPTPVLSYSEMDEFYRTTNYIAVKYK